MEPSQIKPKCVEQTWYDLPTQLVLPVGIVTKLVNLIIIQDTGSITKISYYFISNCMGLPFP